MDNATNSATVLDRLRELRNMKVQHRFFIGSYVPCVPRTRLFSPPRYSTRIAPYILPIPKGVMVVPIDRGYKMDKETRWKTQYNARRCLSSGVKTIEQKSCMGKGGVKGAVKKVTFAEMIVVISYEEKEYDDSDSEYEESEDSEEEEGDAEAEEEEAFFDLELD